MSRPGSVAGAAKDPTIKFAELKAGDKTYKLAYNFNSLAEAEALTGGKVNLARGLAGVMLNSFTAAEFRGLLWAALHTAHPRMTLEDAGTLIKIDNWVDIKDALMDAYNKSLDPDLLKKSEGGEEPPAAEN